VECRSANEKEQSASRHVELQSTLNFIEVMKEATMKMAMTVGSAAALLLLASPAFADFYIIQDAGTKRCRIVEQRPAPNIGVVIGAPFGARIEAENRMGTVEVCRDVTEGRGPGVVIERERERPPGVIIER